jgi:hypothetical protein
MALVNWLLWWWRIGVGDHNSADLDPDRKYLTHVIAKATRLFGFCFLILAHYANCRSPRKRTFALHNRMSALPRYWLRGRPAFASETPNKNARHRHAVMRYTATVSRQVS